MSGKVWPRLVFAGLLSVLSAQSQATAKDQWLAALKEFGALPKAAQAVAVDKWVNTQLRYALDPLDVWQSPLESLELRQGDCEDYAIAKYALLRQLGWQAPAVQLAYGHTTATGVKAAHMVVLALEDDATAPLVLDNLGATPKSVPARDDLTVSFSFSEEFVWRPASDVPYASAARLKKWAAVLLRMREEGSLSQEGSVAEASAIGNPDIVGP